MAEATKPQILLVRHGETEWSLSGQHTSMTDLPLTENGRKRTVPLRKALSKRTFALALTSPLRRARETCELAGPQLEPVDRRQPRRRVARSGGGARRPRDRTTEERRRRRDRIRARPHP